MKWFVLTLHHYMTRYQISPEFLFLQGGTGVVEMMMMIYILLLLIIIIVILILIIIIIEFI